MSHAIWEGKLHQLNLKPGPDGLVRSLYYGPRKQQPGGDRTLTQRRAPLRVASNHESRDSRPFVWTRRGNLAERIEPPGMPAEDVVRQETG